MITNRELTGVNFCRWSARVDVANWNAKQINIVKRLSDDVHACLVITEYFIKRATNDLDQSRPATCTRTLLPLIKQLEPWRNPWSGARRPCMFKTFKALVFRVDVNCTTAAAATAEACGGREQQLLVAVCADKDECAFKQ